LLININNSKLQSTSQLLIASSTTRSFFSENKSKHGDNFQEPSN